MSTRSSLIIGISIVLSFTILGIFINGINSFKDEYKCEQVNIENHSILSLEEAANYLKMSESKLKRIIVIEKSKYGLLIEYKLPFFKVDGEYFFKRSQLDLWSAKIAEQQIEYNTEKFILSN